MRLLILAGLGLSGYLFAAALRAGSLPGCGAGGDCASVLSSRWSRWLGVPVGGPAALLYGVMLGASLSIVPRASVKAQRGGWSLLIVGAVGLAGAAVWFIVLQLEVLRSACSYCMTAHLCGLILAATVLALAPIGRTRLLPEEPADPLLLPPARALLLAACGLILPALLVTGQLALKPAQFQLQNPSAGGADFDTGPGPQRRMSILNQAIQFSPHDLPVLGSPDAPYLIVSLTDYTCPHCRVMHEYLAEVQQRFGGRLGIVEFITPLEAACNPAAAPTEPLHEHACELARLALAVWRVQPEKYVAFDAFLFTGEGSPKPDEARVKAAELVGAAALDGALADPWVERQLRSNVRVYELMGQRANVHRLPVLFLGSAVAVGEPESAEELIHSLQKTLGIKP